jgi:hypothetical protein
MAAIRRPPGTTMNRPLRRLHRVVVMLLAVLLPFLVVAALLARAPW